MTPSHVLPKRGRPRKTEHALNATTAKKRARTLYSKWSCPDCAREVGQLPELSRWLSEVHRPTKPEGFSTPVCRRCSKPMGMEGLYFVGADRRTRELVFVPAEALLDQYDKWRQKVFWRYFRGDLCACGHFENEHGITDAGSGRPCVHDGCGCSNFVAQRDDPNRIARFTAPADEDVPF